MAKDLLALTAEIDSALAIVIAPETTLPQAYINNFKNTQEFKMLKNYFDQYPNTSVYQVLPLSRLFLKIRHPMLLLIISEITWVQQL